MKKLIAIPAQTVVAKDRWQIQGKIERPGKETIREGVCSSGKRTVYQPEFPNTFERRALK